MTEQLVQMQRLNWRALPAGPKWMIAAAILAACIPSTAGSAPPPNSAIGHAVQLAHWQASLEAAMKPQAPDPLDGIGADPNFPPPLPSLRDKYDRAPILVGMGEVMASELKVLIGKLSPQRKQALSGWSVSLGRCAPGGPALLTATDTAAKTLCVAPILVTSLFLGSAGTRMTNFVQYLRTHGVDPSSFDGTYDRRLNQKGVTLADWNAVVGGFSEPTWSRLKRSIDILVARAVFCGALGAPKSTCTKDAVTAVRSVDPVVDASALTDALQSAVSKYDPSSWGYETAGDGQSVLVQTRDATAH